jgi:UDP-GlcNAc:undecaprenyl-phosphate GlcNAc-1-phosphate transferase
MVADRGHVHHRLIDMGFNQKQAVAISYLLTAILGLAAVLLTSSGEFKALILIGAFILVGAIGFHFIFKKPVHHSTKEDGEKEEPNEEN